ncbi:MAG: hypothetical protein R6W96_04250, partial [Clostridia bacterium]
MKKLLDILLLDRNLYKRPVRTRTGLFVLILAAGLVMVAGHFIRTGRVPDILALVIGLGLVLFTGGFAVVAWGWPAADFLCSLDPEVEKFQLRTKRLKLVKGFLYGVILTGTLSGLLEFIIVRWTDFNLSRVLTSLVAVIFTLWAGGIVSRCAFEVFEMAHTKKKLVFILLSVWYYIIVNL